MFFSRQIGIDPITGQEVPINAGAKVTGALGKFELGVMDVDTRVVSRTFPKLGATTVAARECPRGVDHLLSYLEARQVFEEALVSPTLEQSRILAEGRSIYNTAAHDHLFDAWIRDDITEEKILARYSEKQINISIRGYIIRAAFPQNGPKYREVE